MNKFKIPIFQTEKFKSEDEIRDFFAEYLDKVFFNLIHLESEWTIRYQEHEDNNNRVDALAFYEDKKKKLKARAVILEYKHENQADPVNQILRYHSILERKGKENYEHLEHKFKKYLKDRSNWDHKPNIIKDFWNKTLLICIVDRSSYYKAGGYLIKEKADEEKKNVILLEIKRYKDQKNYFVLISLLNKKNRERWQELLGMVSKDLIVQIPTEEWREKKIGKKTKNYQNVPKKAKTLTTKTQKTHPPASENVSRSEKADNKTDLETFLTQFKTDEQLKEIAREINKQIRLLDKSIVGNATQPVKNKYTFFAYHHKEQKSFLSFCLRTREKKIKLYLKKIKGRETTDSIWELNKETGGYQNQFRWITTIKDKKDCEKIINSIKTYLENFREKI